MEKLKEFIKRPQVWGFGLSVVIMALIAVAFFYPDNFEGNSLRQPDMQQGNANGHEAAMYEAETGEKALWTNSLFGGMPTFQISPSYPSNRLFTWLNDVYGLWLPAPSNLLFMMMFGFLILLFTLRLRWYYALIGAVAWGFSSYFIIIIGAGHIWKFLALTYVPPTIAGLLLLYRGHKYTGTGLLALFAMLQLNANHPQMTYYFGLVMVLIVLAYLIEAIRKHKMRRWLVASGLTLAAGALAIGANSPSLYNTYEYSKETKRSQSELTVAASETSGEPAERPTGGMPKSQIVGWSYGRSEMFSLMVPNIKGGASARPEGGQMVAMSLDKLDGGAAAAQNAPLLMYMSQYFNDSEGTNGPVYVGIIIFALFLVGCFIVKGPLKWALVASTIFSIVLALGRNAEGITDFMIYNFPMYSKFRAVESILVVAEFCIPLLAILALDKIMEKGREAWKEYKLALAVGFGLPALVCLAATLVPGVFGEAINSTDRYTAEQVQKQVVDYGRANGLNDNQIQQMVYQYSLANRANLDAATDLRLGMVRADGLRSLCFLLFAACVLWLFIMGKLKYGVAVGALGVAVLADLYPVDKRYVSHSSFGPADPTQGKMVVLQPDGIDRAIMADTAQHYRVLDIPGFYSADRSYFHKTLGGYHAAKLNRYDDIIQHRLAPVVQVGWYQGDPQLDDPSLGELGTQLRNGYAVANMLNAKYIITGNQNAPVLINSAAAGNAWLVDNVKWVDNANEEMAALDVNTLDFTHEAVADRRFAGALPEAPSLAPGDTIYLTSYTPNRLTYHAATANGGIGVFSEVYFPWGWKADIDGMPAEIARVNYLLRAIALPAGSHTVTMSFEPDSIRTTSSIAYACVTLIYMLLCAAIFAALRRCRLI